MEREVNRLVRLASDLLLLAQAETGAILRHEPVALDELVRAGTYPKGDTVEESC